MRRIIERVVTVVTTTTWKISWEADPPHADLVSNKSLLPDGAAAQNTVVETKEVHPKPIESESVSKSNEPSGCS